jgi:hypothetical protein
VIFVVLIIMIVVTGLADFRDRWLLPFLFILPLWFGLKLEAAGVNADAVFRRFAIFPVTLMCLLPLMMLGRVTLAGVVTSYENLNVPYEEFITRIVAEGRHEPAAIVTKSWHNAGNLKMTRLSVPVIATDFPAFNPKVTAWSEERPLLLVWVSKETQPGPLPVELIRWLAANTPQRPLPEAHTISVPYLYSRANEAYQFGYSWVYPTEPTG